MNTASPPTDQAAIGDFQGRVLTDLAGLTTAVLAGIGDRLGLFAHLADGRPVTSAQLATRADVDERYTREWLAAMAGASYLDYDPSAGAFSLPSAHAAVLADEGGPAFIGGMLHMMLGALPVIDEVTTCFRRGGGVPQSAYPDAWWDGMERFSTTYFDHLLVTDWLPAVPAVEALLRTGATVADIGAGAGRGLINLAKAFPNSRYVGYDVHPPNVAHANRRAIEAGVQDLVHFEVLDAAAGLPARFDVVFTFDVVHDAAHPEQLLSAIRDALRPDGRYVCLDINCSHRLEDNTGPLGTFFYGVSTLYCMTTSLAQGGAGLGTAGLPPRTLEALAEAAGFTHVRRAEIDNPFNNLYELVP